MKPGTVRRNWVFLLLMGVVFVTFTAAAAGLAAVAFTWAPGALAKATVAVGFAAAWCWALGMFLQDVRKGLR